MGQGQSTDDTGGWPQESAGGQTGEVRSPPTSGPTVVAAAAAASTVAAAPPSITRLPTPPAKAYADATVTYLNQLIAQAEEQGPLSLHDLALLRFQLDTVRQDAAQRKEDHQRRMQHQLEDEQLAENAGQSQVQPPPAKKLMPQRLAADEPEEDPIALIGLHQARIHAANMEMIRQAQAYHLNQQSESPQPCQLSPQQSSLSSPPPIASADWPMDTRASPADPNGFYSSPLPFYDQHESQQPPFTPFLSASVAETEADSSSQPAQSTLACGSLRGEEASSSSEASEEAHNLAIYDLVGKDPVHMPAGFQQPNSQTTAARNSKIFLRNYVESGALETLESEYGSGNFSADGVRQFLMSIIALLEPDDQDELMKSFSKMNLKGCEHVLATCPHIDIQPTPGVPCCPQRAGVGSSSAVFKQALAELESKMLTSAIPQGMPFCEAMTTLMDGELANSLSTALAQDLSPLEAAPDDLDGIARMRFHIIFSKPNQSVKNKRKKLSSDDPDVDPVLSPSRTPAEPPLRVYRMAQVNKAFELLSGFSQSGLRRDAILRARPSGAFESLRADHVRATHIIHTQWRLNNVTEGHIYQVRRRFDGIEVYCLLHVKYHVDHGVTLGVEHAIIPLPVDEAHPIPPFVEGVDLEVDTLLYGYKPPLNSTA